MTEPPDQPRADDDPETQVTASSTGTGGQPEPPVDNSPVDPVRAALAGARRMAQGLDRNRRPGRTGRSGRPARRDAHADGDDPTYSGAGSDERDPEAIGAVLAGYTEDRGWQRPLAEARVFADWASIVGDEVAAHCMPTALRDGELRVAAQSTAWATQLRLLSGTMLARLVAEVGAETVRRLVITGPVAPSWKHGRLSVPGSRGPRDTYG